MRNYVVWVHGIGTQKEGARRGFERRIRSAFRRRVRNQGGRPPDDAIVWENAHWADVTQGDQEELKRALGIRGALQTFFVDSLGDAAAYSRLRSGGGKFEKIQKVFADALGKLSETAIEKEGADAVVPVTVVAHSLGAVIATGTIDHLKASNTLPLNLELRHMFTMGSPVAVYGLRYGFSNFDKPTEVDEWVNLFYSHDLIGYPLQPLGGQWRTRVRDVELSSGGGVGLGRRVFRSVVGRVNFARNVLSHGWYFNDSRVVGEIATALAEEWARPGDAT